ncbi:hypothetical protein ES707_14763 [subsurface metagenome]
MDIRNWPLDRIMQLPDCCFGRRYVISASALSSLGVLGYDISELALPERCVIWELAGWAGKENLDLAYFRIALGDQLPTTVAQMNALEPLIPGFGPQGPEPRRIDIYVNIGKLFNNIRMPLAAAGRRLVLEVASLPTKNCRFSVAVVVSSIPTEVPDWLCSGRV